MLLEFTQSPASRVDLLPRRREEPPRKQGLFLGQFQLASSQHTQIVNTVGFLTRVEWICNWTLGIVKFHVPKMQIGTSQTARAAQRCCKMISCLFHLIKLSRQVNRGVYDMGSVCISAHTAGDFSASAVSRRHLCSRASASLSRNGIQIAPPSVRIS